MNLKLLLIFINGFLLTEFFSTINIVNISLLNSFYLFLRFLFEYIDQDLSYLPGLGLMCIWLIVATPKNIKK